MTGDRANDLYVAYLPTPRRHRRFLRLVVPTILWGLCAIAAVIAANMAPTGQAVWNTSDTKRFVGTIVARPYPAIITGDHDDFGQPATIFLVEPGKVGVRNGLEQLRTRQARVEGFLLSRGDRQVLELLPGDTGVATLEQADARDSPAPQRLGTATLRGEIVDYKCFLGAMKPGHGLTHRACATLCISGGIPPALVVRDASGAETYYILRSPDRERLNEHVLPFVATPIEIRGDVVRERDVLYLETTADQINRL